MSEEAEVTELRPDDKPETGRRRKTRNPNRDEKGHFTSGPGGPKAAPRRGRGRPKARPARDDLEAPLGQMLTMVATFWHGIEESRYLDHPTPTCGTILAQQAPAIAFSLNAVAQDNDSVYRWLSSMMTGGGWGAVAVATLPVANAVLSRHTLPAMSSLAERRRSRGRHEPSAADVESEDYEERERNEGPSTPTPIPAPEPDAERFRPPNEIPPGS